MNSTANHLADIAWMFVVFMMIGACLYGAFRSCLVFDDQRVVRREAAPDLHAETVRRDELMSHVVVEPPPVEHDMPPSYSETVRSYSCHAP